jgi:hypothetical protein
VIIGAVLLSGCRLVASYDAPAPDAARPDVGQVGALGLPCYPNASCNAPLRCLGGRCVPPPDAGPPDLPPPSPDKGITHLPPRCDAGAVSLVGGTIETVAGGQAGGLDGPAASATFRAPVALAAAAGGGLLIADRDNHRLRLLRCGEVSTFAGSGKAGYQNGPVESARFASPSGLAVTASGVVYVADTVNRRIRRIAAGMVSTAAGSGASGLLDGLAASASFVAPRGLAYVEATQALYIADTGAGRIRELREGKVRTVAFYLDGPTALVSAAPGTLLVTENVAHRVVRVDVATKSSQVIVGSADAKAGAGYVDGLLGLTRFTAPGGLTTGADGALYVADTGNRAVRLIGDLSDAAAVSQTLVGDPQRAGNADGPLASASLLAPMGLLWLDGVLYIADAAGHRLRRLRR